MKKKKNAVKKNRKKMKTVKSPASPDIKHSPVIYQRVWAEVRREHFTCWPFLSLVYRFLTRKLTINFSPSFLTPVNCGTASLCLYIFSFRRLIWIKKMKGAPVMENCHNFEMVIPSVGSAIWVSFFFNLPVSCFSRCGKKKCPAGVAHPSKTSPQPFGSTQSRTR